MKSKRFLATLLALIMVLSCMSITAFAENSTYLDIEDGDTYSDSQALDQNYTLTTEAGDYTDVTKVKLDWEIKDINANRKDTKSRDPDNLVWKDTDTQDAVSISQNGSAKFTLTNLSSVKVNVQATFKAESGFNPTVTYAETSDTANDGKVTLGTVVKSDKTVDKDIDHDEEINVTVTPAKADFATLSATASATKYGTYTVTFSVSNNYSVSFNLSGVETTAIPTQTLAAGSKVTKPTDPTDSEGATFGGWYTDADFQTEWNFETDTVNADTVLYAKWLCTVTIQHEGYSYLNKTVTVVKGSTIVVEDNELFIGGENCSVGEGCTYYISSGSTVTSNMTITCG